MRVTDKLFNKNQWIKYALIVAAIMILKSTVSGYVGKYIPLTGVFLEFVVLLIIIVLSDTILSLILEV